MTVGIGHNQGPTLSEHAAEASKEIGTWLDDHPVIQTEEEAREGKLLYDRARLCNKDLEDERKKEVGPLNEKVKEINARFKSILAPLDGARSLLKGRLDSFLRLEEERLQATAQAARLAAEELAERVRQAEEAVCQAENDASLGVCTTGELATALERDSAVAELELAERTAARAEREASRTKIGGGFTKALSARQRESLVIVDVVAAIFAMGVHDDIYQALCKAAREYRREHGHLPPGIEATYERAL